MIIIFGLLTLYIQSMPITAYMITRSQELPTLDISSLESSEAIVVLGGGLKNNSYEYESGVSVNRSTLARLLYTAYLAKIYPNKLVVTSGGYNGKIREGDVMKRVLIDSFDVKNPILVEDNSRNTDENAKFVAKILLAKDIHNITLVTQAYHMARAMMLFKKYGLNPTAASTDYYYSPNAKISILYIIPNASAMLQIAVMYHEILGNLIYK